MSEHATAPPPKFVRVAVPILFVVSVVGLAGALFLSPPKRRAVPATPPVDVAPPVAVPAFTLTERSGRPVSNTDLLGKVWVASFVFAQCTTTCPQVTGTMYRLQSDLDLAHQPDLRLVSFSMDPDDTPDVLKKYAAEPHRPADPDRWLFLSSPTDDIQKLMKQGFKLAFERNATPDAPPGLKYNHGTFVFVVDKKGFIRGHFDGYQGPSDETGERYADSLARLARTVRELLAE